MREFAIVPFAVKAVGASDGATTFEGYGSVFNTVDSYGDTIARGAFESSLREWHAKGKLPKLLLQHGGGFLGGADDLIPIGKWESMTEDAHGLLAKGRLFDVNTDRARATAAALKEGELDGLSIGFQTRKSTRDETTGIRTLTDINLWEVSLVTFPANDPARITTVKADGTMLTEREFERFLRDAGFSRDHAKGITARGYRALRREVASEDSAALNDVLASLTARTALFHGDPRQ